MCGIVGIALRSIDDQVNQLLFDALTISQHRGQDSAGIMTYDGRIFNRRRGIGLVKECIHTRHMIRLKGNAGLGHVRYPTSGRIKEEECQPFYMNMGNGISFVHNGNIINTEAIQKELSRNYVHLNTDSDSEMLASLFALYIHKNIHNKSLSEKAIQNALREISEKCVGSYSCIAIIAGIGMLAFRDPNGIKPLEVGVSSNMRNFIVASESVALSALPDVVHAGEIPPGSYLFVPFNSKGVFGNIKYGTYVEGKEFTPCIFEYVYLSRPDSIINKISVSEARRNMGRKLAMRMIKDYNTDIIDVVVPVPDTSLVAAVEMAATLNKPYRYGLIKNRYLPRTFIMPGQKIREESVRLKLNVSTSEVKGKNVLVVDDSIVRGTTSRQIVFMLKDAGAKKITFASLSPPIRYRNIYGVDIPTKSELVAWNRTTDEIRDFIGADVLIYQDISDLEQSILEAAPKNENQIIRFEMSIFDGKYLAGITDEYLDLLE